MLDQGIDGFAETRAALAGDGHRNHRRGRRRAGSQTHRSRRFDVAPRRVQRMAQCQPAGLRRPRDHAGRSCTGRFCRAAGKPRPTSPASSRIGTGSSVTFRGRRPERWRDASATRGAGLIVGHHAHVLQPAERIGGTLVAYGLGDFLGTALARLPWPGRIGAMLAVDVSAEPATRGRVAAYELVPFFRRGLAQGSGCRLWRMWPGRSASERAAASRNCSPGRCGPR